MDENMEVMTEEATTPTEDMTEDVGEPLTETSATEDTEEQTEATTPTEETVEPEAQEPAAGTLPVKFRHEHRDLTMEEARSYAQMGLKYESLQPTMDKLRMMAAGRGQSLEEFVNNWAAAEERAVFEQLLEKTGGDRETAEKLLRLEQADRQSACDARVQQEQQAVQDEKTAVTHRLAAEFNELQKEFPTLGSFDALPETVIRDAVTNGRHLLDAYLRHAHSENKKVAENEAAGRLAETACVGSQTDHPAANTRDGVTEAMLRGIRSVFGN